MKPVQNTKPIRHTPLQKALTLDMKAINKVIGLCFPTEGQRKSMHQNMETTLMMTISQWSGRSLVPVRTVHVTDAPYEHAPEDNSPPKFPNGYPVLVIEFNGTRIGVIGVMRKGNEFECSVYETTGSRFLLETAH